MKSISKIVAGVLLISGMIAVISGCVKKEFDTPPVYVPRVNFKANCTIDSLKRIYLPDTLGTVMTIKTDIIIKGILSANDESGNIYKTLYIQDNTGGLVLGIDQASLYVDYKVGQMIYVKCKGLYLGTYGGVIQLGYPYNGSIGRMPAAYISTHIYKDSLPGKPPAVDTLDLTADLSKKISTLVAVKNVRFPDWGQPFVTGNVTTNRDIADVTNTPIQIGGENFIIRTSNYASFATSKLPAGKGTLQGILSYYNGQYQMYVRDLNDLIKFDTTGMGKTDVILYEQYFDASPTDWVVQTVSGNKPWTWDGTYKCMVGNGYQGNAPCETWLVSPGIDLAGVSVPVLTFKTWTGYTDSGNPNPLSVKISTNYSGSGDPTTATWTDLPCTLPAANSKVWTSSGDVSLDAYIGHKVYICYIYKSSGTTASTASKWEVDTFKAVGKK